MCLSYLKISRHIMMGSDGLSRLSPSNKIHTSVMSRTYSGPTTSDNSLPRDRPMRLSEIHVAAEHALRFTISDPHLWTSLSSVEEFEAKYIELTKGAADNYHRSWWKRHGVVLDGEIAAICFKHGNIDLAAKSYEKVCALFAGEGWHNLLAEVLPNLAECQKILNDQAGYLSSCVRLLSLDNGLFLRKERQAFQAEVIHLAYSAMKDPVPLDVSSLITFSGNPGPPLQLCDGDPGRLSVIVWSGFPDDITLESLSLTLIATFSADEGVKAIKCSSAPVLRPGKNIITLDLPPQKPGSYVLGVLTGHIGNLIVRSHSFSKGGPPDSDDFMNYEKPTRPVLKVFKPRPLVDISAAISSALLMNEPQWVGLVIRPIDYPLKGAILQIDTGPELVVEDSHVIEIENYSNTKAMEIAPHIEAEDSNGTSEDVSSVSTYELKQLVLENGQIELPDWASNVNTIVWLPVRAIDNKLARGTSAVYPQRQSVVDGMRTIALKLDFGVAHNQTFERTIAVHFTDPFHISTRVADKCSAGSLLLQVIIHSQVKACLKIDDAWLELQAGFLHVGKGDGRPVSSSFPLILAPSSRAGILFSICLGSMINKGESEALPVDSILNIRYGISGNRSTGAHAPVAGTSEGSKRELLFKSSLALQQPVLNPCLAVGFLPFPSDCLRVGQLVSMKWRVERLKTIENTSPSDHDEFLYEVDANPENWMVAGRKRGHVALSTKQGSRIVITVSCMPLISGYVRPPQLALPCEYDANISCTPPGPHLVCVLPPTLSSSYCVPS
uniref:Trafficking protein particle complex subunit 10 n=1 Tax=Anthurium amnicola TaxID=1678845 RepID=A0A1D1Y829_9ARAE